VTEQNLIFCTKQNQNIKEVVTGALSILNIRRENRVVGDVSTGFGKSMIFTCFAQVKEEMSHDHNLSSKNGI